MTKRSDYSFERDGNDFVIRVRADLITEAELRSLLRPRERPAKPAFKFEVRKNFGFTLEVPPGVLNPERARRILEHLIRETEQERGQTVDRRFGALKGELIVPDDAVESLPHDHLPPE